MPSWKATEASDPYARPTEISALKSVVDDLQSRVWALEQAERLRIEHRAFLQAQVPMNEDR